MINEITGQAINILPMLYEHSLKYNEIQKKLKKIGYFYCPLCNEIHLVKEQYRNRNYCKMCYKKKEKIRQRKLRNVPLAD